MKNGRPDSLEHLNLCSRIRRWTLFLATLIAICAEAPIFAVELHAFYTAACQRQIGVILGANNHQIYVLSVRGEIVPVDRFAVIYWATYPIDVFPIKEVQNPELVPLIRIDTLEGSNLATLVRGWPVDFSKEKVAFLTLKGREIIIDRSGIYHIESEAKSEAVRFEEESRAQYVLEHPYAFSGCPKDAGWIQSASRDGTPNRVFPQQVLSDPISIKREFDRLAEGHQLLKKYEQDQQFYPIPEVYTNQTALGMWFLFGSRYGASGTRNNNFTPLLVDRSSSGPFGFQQEFITGSGPLPYGLHEEAQTQLHYRFKADYFHFSAMLDPSLLLVGSKYDWRISDVSESDIRVNDTGMIEFGFDYARWSLGISSGGYAIGAKYGGRFDSSKSSISKWTLRYQSYRWIAEIWAAGSSAEDTYSIRFLRLNLFFNPNRDWRITGALINRKVSYDGLSSPAHDDFLVETTSQTLLGIAEMRFRRRYWVGAMAAIENFESKSGLSSLSESSSKVYPKGGASISLSF